MFQRRRRPRSQSSCNSPPHLEAVFRHWRVLCCSNYCITWALFLLLAKEEEEGQERRRKKKNGLGNFVSDCLAVTGGSVYADAGALLKSYSVLGGANDNKLW